jgi:hypothetical protein
MSFLAKINRSEGCVLSWQPLKSLSCQRVNYPLKGVSKTYREATRHHNYQKKGLVFMSYEVEAFHLDFIA